MEYAARPLPRARFLAAAAGLAGSLVAAGSPIKAATTLRIGTLPLDQTAEPFYAEASGIFAASDIAAEISVLNNGPAIASAIVSGAMDVGYSNGVTLAIAHERGLPFKIIFTANMYNAKMPVEGLLSVLKSSPIRSAKDLNGKTIGVGGLNTNVPLCARLWIDQNGGDSSAVKFIEVPFSTMLDAIRAQRIDAAQLTPAGDPTIGTAGDDFRVLGNTYSSLGAYYPSGFWFTSAAFMESNPDAVTRFRSAMRKTAVWAATHHHESAAALAKQTNRSIQQIEAVPRVAYGTSMTASMLQPTIDLAARYGLLAQTFSATELVGSSVS